MDGPPVQETVQQLEELMQALEDLRRRVAALEQRSAIAPSHAELPLTVPGDVVLPEVSPGLLAPLGRLLLGIAGAYLLRAITEAGIIPELTGTLAGLLYAGGWLVASMRTAASNRISLVVEGLTASAIAAPLLWESTARFHAIPPAGAAAALGFFIVLGQVVAWKQEHVAIGAITALAGAATALALITATLDPVPFAVALLIAAAVVEYGAIRDHALGWRWIMALTTDFCAFLLIYLTTRPQGPPQGYAFISATAAIAIQIALVALYVASMAARTLIRQLSIGWFEIVQVAAVVVFAIVTNLRWTSGLGALLMAAAGACYLAAFRGTASTTSRNFYVYAAFGLSLLLTGSFLFFHGLAMVSFWSVLALAAIWTGERRNDNISTVHGAIYLLAGTVASVQVKQYWLPAIAAALAYGVMLWSGRQCMSAMERVPRAVVAALIACCLYEISTRFASSAQTVLISGVGIALGWFGKRWNLTELIWVLYPWMAFGAVKLLADEFRDGSPATLFLSLLVYGGTLIALPRLLRRTSSLRTDLS